MSTSRTVWAHVSPVRLGLAALLAGALVAGAFRDARGAWPPDEKAGPVDYSSPASWPSDPGYGGRWNYHSFAPAALTKLDARTRRLGTGAHVDRAWAKTAGDPRVLIAVLDSGAYWDNPDLVNKWFLSAAELPVPDLACQKDPANPLHDANRDGVFNVQDYTRATGHAQPAFAKACDPRVRDKNGNGLLDPQDLIAAFSDGKDDDKNGYVDDIAGWDFFRNDNDAYDEVRYGHGNGEAEDSSAEGDNGIDSIGTCPRCRVTPLRVGDSFVADANDFALAVAYAVDAGASVVQEALGTIDNTPLSRWAIDYAYDNHVAVIASAADENSFHHNFPGTNNHTIYVHSIRYNADDLKDATHTFAFDNCTNYGAQLQLSVPGTSCSSEATGRGAGMAGLLYSAALSAGLPAPPRLHPPAGGDAPAGDGGPEAARVRRLTAEEVRQILIGTADSFYDPAEDDNPAAYPSGPGFVRRFGYGRPNVRSAVDRILLGALPPQVEIESPEWFQVLSRDGGEVPIKGRIALRSATLPGTDSFDYVVEWAPGVDPKDDRFRRLGHGEMVSGGLDGTLGTLPVFDLQVQNPVPMREDPAWQPDDAAHVYAITVRVRATLRSTDPQRNGLVGEARRSVHVRYDADLLPGFPVRLGASGESSPKTADLDGDGKREIVVADSGGLVHAITASGKELPGWPVAMPVMPALTSGARGHRGAPAWSEVGTRPRPGLGQAVLASPAIGDVNGDGKDDVVVATYDGAVLAIGADGKILPGFPVQTDGVAATVAIDPRHVIDDGIFASPVLVDLDGDKRLDIVVAAMDGQVYVWKGDGQRAAGFPVLIGDGERPDDPMDAQPRQRARLMGTPAAGDLNGDGIPDLVLPSNEQYDVSARVYAVDGRGNKAPRVYLPGWPVTLGSRNVLPVVGIGIPNAPALGDADGDGVPEVFINGLAGPLEILKKDGTPFGTRLSPNRQSFGDATDATEASTLGFIASPALGDLDGDGHLDAVLPTAGMNLALSMLKSFQRADYEMHFSAWDTKTGQQKPGFPRTVEDYQFFVNPIIVDLDADGQKEVVGVSAGYFVHAWNAAGKEPAGFPKFTGGWNAATPTVGDLDGDGRLELVASSRNGFLFAWKTRGRARGRMDWPSFHHDLRNTGNLATALDQGGDEVDAVTPPADMASAEPEEGGMSCSATGHHEPPGAEATLFALCLLALYARQRRRLLS